MTSVHNKEDPEQGCCLPPPSCFLTPGGLLSAPNETRLAPSHAGVGGKMVSLTLPGEASVKTASPPEPRSSGADAPSPDAKGGGESVRVAHHYSC